jgi:hypothetical protein
MAKATKKLPISLFALHFAEQETTTSRYYEKTLMVFVVATFSRSSLCDGEETTKCNPQYRVAQYCTACCPLLQKKVRSLFVLAIFSFVFFVYSVDKFFLLFYPRSVLCIRLTVSNPGGKIC